MQGEAVAFGFACALGDDVGQAFLQLRAEEPRQAGKEGDEGEKEYEQDFFHVSVRDFRCVIIAVCGGWWGVVFFLMMKRLL